MKLTLGIDEAGRGPVIGPMVMAGVVLSTRAARLLSRAGLRDSKSYGASNRAREIRAQLAAQVTELATFVSVHVIDVTVIDRRVQRKELNVLEREVARKIIADAPRVQRIVADGRVMFAPLRQSHPGFEALNNGESQHASVAAASVVAKNRRDEIFRRIAIRYAGLFGEVTGGGYSNARTTQFLRDYAQKFRTLPPEARRSWPHPYLHDILGPQFNPYADVPDEAAGQLALW